VWLGSGAGGRRLVIRRVAHGLGYASEGGRVKLTAAVERVGADRRHDRHESGAGLVQVTP